MKLWTKLLSLTKGPLNGRIFIQLLSKTEIIMNCASVKVPSVSEEGIGGKGGGRAAEEIRTNPA